MASGQAKYNVGAVLLLVFLLLLSYSSYSSARPLNNDFSFKSTGSTILTLVLPSDSVKERSAGNAFPCDRHVAGIRLLRGGKYGPLIMNMLPKGKIPPSGPSKGSNDINT